MRGLSSDDDFDSIAVELCCFIAGCWVRGVGYWMRGIRQNFSMIVVTVEELSRERDRVLYCWWGHQSAQRFLRTLLIFDNRYQAQKMWSLK